MIGEDKDRLECLKLAVSLLIPQKPPLDFIGTRTVEVANIFYSFITEGAHSGVKERPSMAQLQKLRETKSSEWTV